jgi:tol-pal system protein YbgF
VRGRLTLRKQFIFLSLLVFSAGVGVIPAFGGNNKDLLRIEQQLDNLQQSVEAMQKTLDTQTASLKTLLELQNQQIERMSAAIADIQRANQQNLATNSNKIDGMTSQIQALGESLEEAKARIAKLSDQIAQTQNIIQTLRAPNPVAQPGTEGTEPATEGQPSTPPAPDPDTLYQSAYSAYTGGQYQIAMQAFQQYLQYYSTSDRASNAQFYVGECYYLQGDYAQAIQAYNRCIEQYPDGNKVAAAQLKKGLAYVALGQTTNGAKELRSLIQRYPSSPEAKIARQKLQKLGSPAPRHR